MSHTYPIHIAYCANDAYVRYVTVSLRSVAESHRGTPVTVHILSDDIQAETQLRVLEEMKSFPDMDIHFRNVDDSDLRGLEAWSKYTWYRLLIPGNIPADVHRVLYLDADTLVCDKLTPLFGMNMEGKAVAGVVDPMSFADEAFTRCGYPRSKGYLCAGVLMMNLDHWRSRGLAPEMIRLGLEHKEWRYHDQDVINYLCQDSKIQWPLRYGVVDSLFALDDIYREPYLQQVRGCMEAPAIIHYAGTAPWLKDAVVHPLDHRWHDVNSRLQWPVRKSYRSKGWLRAKIFMFNLLHPGYKRTRVTLAGILSRL